MRHYIFVINGEVAWSLSPINGYPEGSAEADKYFAIMESDPRIVPSDEAIPEGWTWDGKNFNPPVE